MNQLTIRDKLCMHCLVGKEKCRLYFHVNKVAKLLTVWRLIRSLLSCQHIKWLDDKSIHISFSSLMKMHNLKSLKPLTVEVKNIDYNITMEHDKGRDISSKWTVHSWISCAESEKIWVTFIKDQTVMIRCLGQSISKSFEGVPAM